MATILTWTAPTTFADGSPLPADVIQGYNIYTGPNLGAMTLRLTVGPSPTSVLLSSIPSYSEGLYVAVSAFTEISESALTIGGLAQQEVVFVDG